MCTRPSRWGEFRTRGAPVLHPEVLRWVGYLIARITDGNSMRHRGRVAKGIGVVVEVYAPVLAAYIASDFATDLAVGYANTLGNEAPAGQVWTSS